MDFLNERSVPYDEGRKQITYVSGGPTNGPLLVFLHGWPSIGKVWRLQLTTFVSLGFYVVAPDMPGYGKSTSNKKFSDYAQQALVPSMVAMLADTGREDAVWIAHDWGCGVLWALASTHPHLCRGIVSLCVPYRVLELGLDELLKFVNREVYPENKYPYGQWSYQVFYEQNFETATSWLDSNTSGALRLLYGKGGPSALGKPAITANVVKDGGWFGGPSVSPEPPPKSQVPYGTSTLDALESGDVQELEEAMEKTGFFGANAYYMNHKANREWILKNSVNDGVLEMPVLFIEAKYDTSCDTVNSRLMDPMKRLCKDLTKTSIDAGHWVQIEKPQETNAAIARWLVETLPDYWPGYYANAFARRPKRGE